MAILMILRLQCTLEKESLMRTVYVAETYTVDSIWDEEVFVHHHSVYSKKNDDTSKEIQEDL
jgi:hypothetical protein